MSDLAEYLRPTKYLDSEHPAVAAFARESVGEADSDRERAVRLFYAVRDAIRYDPYTFRLTPETYVASETLASRQSFCVPKAILLSACARAVGVPARLRFADVRNHLTTERLREVMGTDVFVFHGYSELFLGGVWVKATPTFNEALCARFGVRPLDFDGEHDSIFHAYDTRGEKHMDYLRDRGSYADFPLDVMMAAMREGYPHLFGDAHREAATSEAAHGAVGDFPKEAKPLE